MTQPDLVSKLRELITLKCEYRDKMRTGSNWLASEQSKEMAELQIQMTERFIGELESLLGLEGQAAEPPTDPLFTELKVRRWLHYFKDDYAAIASAINAVVKQAYKLAQPSPSTPIVPSTAGLSAFEHSEIVRLSSYPNNGETVAEYVETLLMAAKPAEPLTEWQSKVIAFAHEHGEPWSIFAAMENWKERFQGREAQIRKDVLQGLTEKDVAEAYQSAPNWHSVLSSIVYRALAERPAPAGEVKESPNV